ncbi:hypothetical protein AB0F91_30155 [Amycolatopsis sp. NPDC023774]|uniref:hypothetical protein n=1 Tax=Amycolatopsis sp. NPDC023774 TaxID=3155015 RepID=UPI0033D742D0
MRRLLSVVVLLFIGSGEVAHAADGAPVYLADGGGTVSLATAGGKVQLADAKDPGAAWTYDKASQHYRNVASGQCLAAQSPVDGVGVLLAACADGDHKQQ